MVKGMLNVTGPTNTQEDGFVSSQYLMSIECKLSKFSSVKCLVEDLKSAEGFHLNTLTQGRTLRAVNAGHGVSSLPA
eukprot:1141569-Pelagomonas_calceolata.AAC.1